MDQYTETFFWCEKEGDETQRRSMWRRSRRRPGTATDNTRTDTTEDVEELKKQGFKVVKVIPMATSQPAGGTQAHRLLTTNSNMLANLANNDHKMISTEEAQRERDEKRADREAEGRLRGEEMQMRREELYLQKQSAAR
mmetsp:Transcript_3687/g.10717  ORF Transcript_3687/g.10717 Transcript_3687/m.10717 type:complete len:139 (-) Transcript_3687:861-1277(-)